MSARHLVSIVVPCFNAEATVGAAIQSCLAQTHRPIEIIVVDDGSTDGSRAVIEEYAHRFPAMVRCVSRTHKGPAAARNIGASLARGAYVQWLDADDLLEPDKIRPQAAFLDGTLGIDVVFGDWKRRVRSERWNAVVDQRCTFQSNDFLLAYVSGEWVALHAFLMRRSLVKRYRWDERLQALEDHDYWLQQAFRGARFTRIEARDCAVYCIRPEATSRNRMSRSWLEASLEVRRKTHAVLDQRGLLELPTHRRALGVSYVGTAWMALINEYTEVAEQALAAANGLISPRGLAEIDWKLPPFPALGLRRSLLLHKHRKFLKDWLKNKVYRLGSFDAATTWQDNLHRRWAELSRR